MTQIGRAGTALLGLEVLWEPDPDLADLERHARVERLRDSLRTNEGLLT